MTRTKLRRKRIMVDVTQIIVAVIGLLGIVVTAIVAPLIKAKTTTAQWDNIVAWANTAVAAAEVIYKGAGRGEEKREYVINWVTNEAKKHGIKVDVDAVRIALENAWKQMTESEV